MRGELTAHCLLFYPVQAKGQDAAGAVAIGAQVGNATVILDPIGLDQALRCQAAAMQRSPVHRPTHIVGVAVRHVAYNQASCAGGALN